MGSSADANPALCERCGAMLPIALTACPACGALRSSADAVTRAQIPARTAEDGAHPSAQRTEDASVEDSRLQQDADGFADDARFQTGQKILGHYVVVRQLGRGGMGTVYLAKDDVSGQEVAVKVLPASLARERDIRERFTQEARALASMDHPNIVPLVTFAQDGEDRCLVMKYLPGESLDARIRRLHVLPASEARTVLRALLSALGYAHARGVIHRDVKPSNVIIEGDLAGEHRIVLVDFGIAKKDEGREKLTQTGMLMGTPQYMSPEQIGGHSVDGRSDLYAAGLVLFEMLCGRPPFDGQKTFQVLRAHVEQPVPDVKETRGSDVPDDLVALTHMLLAKDPGERPADAQKAIELLDGSGSFPLRETRPPRPSPPTPATARMALPDLAPPNTGDPLENPSIEELRAVRTRGGVLLAAALGAVVVLATVWALRRNAPSPELPRAATDAGASAVDDDLRVNLLVSKARVALEDGDIEDARVAVDAALGLRPTAVDAHLLRAQLLLAADLLDEAHKELARTAGLQGLGASETVALAELEARLTLQREQKQAAAESAARERRERERRERSRGTPPSRLSSDTLSGVTRATSLLMQRCYEDEVLKKRPKAEGEVVMTARVQNTGRVDSVDVKIPAALRTGAFSSCVRNAAMKWRFPPWQGATDEYRHKIYFRPG